MEKGGLACKPLVIHNSKHYTAKNRADGCLKCSMALGCSEQTKIREQHEHCGTMSLNR